MVAHFTCHPGIICLMKTHEFLYIHLTRCFFSFCVAERCAYLALIRVVFITQTVECASENESERDEERLHPRLGLHPSLESACAVITVSNRWEDAFEEDGGYVCACTLVHLPPDHSPLPSHFLLHCHLSCLHMLSPSAGSSGQSLRCRNSGISYALKVIYHISPREGYTLGKTDAIR